SYGGSYDLFYEFISNMVIRSLQIVLDAINGKDIDEPEDLDKKLYLLEKELEILDPENDIKKQYSKDVLIEVYNLWISTLLTKSVFVIQKFNKLFTGT